MKPAKAILEYSVHLDAARGLAALVVFLSHVPQLFLRPDFHKGLAHAMGNVSKTIQGNPQTARLSIGHEAVVVFFVLSGFFVGGSTVRSLEDGRWSWKDYLPRRLTRLWVVLIPALSLGWLLDTLGIGLFSNITSIYGGPAGQHEIAANLMARLTPTVLCGNLFFMQGILVPTFGTETPLWSLSYEFWYYIAFPLLAISLATKSSVLRRLFTLVALVALLIFCGASISRYFSIWLLGVVVSRLPAWRRPVLLRWTIPATCLLLLSTTILVVGRSWKVYPSDLLVGTVFSTLLWLLLQCREPAVSSPYRTVASGLSGMSYTLYAVHLPILVFLNAVVMPHWNPWPLTPLWVAATIGIVVVTFLVAYGIYRCFEVNTDEVRRFVVRLLGLRDPRRAPSIISQSEC